MEEPARKPLNLRPGWPGWPTELTDIEAPPDQLWVRGNLAALAHQPRIGIVGSRTPTPYGEAQAERFADELARAGFTVVSGLARGVDARAHRAALAAGGATVAVLGCGVDRPWPNDELTEDLAQHGCLLSEFAPGTAPRRHHFPLRNRLISGLSTAVLVVEAAERSGSLITARWANDQGRTVFAIPGRIDHPMSRGAHSLLRDGATLARDPLDVLRDLGLEGGTAAPGTPEPTDDLLRALLGETRTAPELARVLGRKLGPVLAELAEAEVAGRVVRTPGGLYRLA